MQVLVEPKERIFNLVNELNDLQLREIADYMQFILRKNHNDTLDLIKASEGTLDFWDNEEDAVWDNVAR
jgi:hypothetical protein